MLNHRFYAIICLYCLLLTISALKAENATKVYNSVNSATVPTAVTEPINIKMASTTPSFIANIAHNLAENETHAAPNFAETSDAYRRVFCACNLHLNLCDINCCCDYDCPKHILKVFNCQLEPNPSIWSKRLADFQYDHGLPSCGVNDGWLCVFHSNQQVQKNKPKINFDTSHRHKWPVSMSEENKSKDQLNLLDFYRFGETIKLMNMKTKQIHNFELPAAFMTANCDIKYPIKHLVSRKYACYVKNMEELEINKQQLMQLALQTKLLSTPKLQQQSMDFKNKQPYLANITLQSCRLDLNDMTSCIFLKNFDNFTAEEEEELLYTSKISIKIYHNYTNILQGLVTFTEIQAIMQLENNDYWQHVEIDFIHQNLTLSNETKNMPNHRISGPLGYLQGEPVIVARMSHNNTLDFFDISNSSTQNMLFLFSTQQKVCHKTNLLQDRINFGINVQKQCLLQLDNETFSTMSMDKQSFNYTAICTTLQRLAWMQLFNLPPNSMYADNSHFLWEYLNSMYVSQLGRPRNQANKWTQLQIQHFELVPLIATHDEETNSFTCRNMLLSISYEFHVMYLEEEQIPHQATIKRATLMLDQLHDLEFSLFDTEHIEVPLLINIMFYNTIMQGNSTSVCKNKIDFYLILVIVFILINKSNYI